MGAPAKIVQSGLHPHSWEEKVLRQVDEICLLFHGTVKASVDRIKAAEEAAIARLETYVPTERLLDRHEAAAYLKLRVRQLDVMTRPGSTEIPFNKIGGLKRFRKCRLDEWLEGEEIKKKAVQL